MEILSREDNDRTGQFGIDVLVRSAGCVKTYYTQQSMRKGMVYSA